LILALLFLHVVITLRTLFVFRYSVYVSFGFVRCYVVLVVTRSLFITRCSLFVCVCSFTLFVTYRLFVVVWLLLSTFALFTFVDYVCCCFVPTLFCVAFVVRYSFVRLCSRLFTLRSLRFVTFVRLLLRCLRLFVVGLRSPPLCVYCWVRLHSRCSLPRCSFVVQRSLLPLLLPYVTFVPLFIRYVVYILLLFGSRSLLTLFVVPLRCSVGYSVALIVVGRSCCCCCCCCCCWDVRLFIRLPFVLVVVCSSRFVPVCCFAVRLPRFTRSLFTFVCCCCCVLPSVERCVRLFRCCVLIWLRYVIPFIRSFTFVWLFHCTFPTFVVVRLRCSVCYVCSLRYRLVVV
jgi:hypothetical protein